MTSQLLGFDNVGYNVVNAQMSRGKVEKIVSFALGSIASTLARFSMDACMYMNQNYGFITFPDQFTTGSSIMPHKKNPDVFELVRAKGNKLQSLSNEIALITTNLPSGYHRDLQLIKESFMPAFEDLHTCLQMTEVMVKNVIVNEHILDDEKYSFLFSVEEVNRLVLNGLPFRDAYKQVGKSIMDGSYRYSKEIHHTHEGSIGNLCNEEIVQKMNHNLGEFHYEKVDSAFQALLQKAVL
jgi:argininosuccinate lyase